MSGFPFPTPQHKWMNITEAKTPLIQDLIKIWEESPGYILPQGSFIKDKAKLEALIDNLIEAQKQKILNATPKAVAKVAPKVDSATGDDPNWEKNLVKALSTAKIIPNKPATPTMLPLPPLPDLKNIPGAEEKIAQLQLVSKELPVKDVLQTKVVSFSVHKHLLILYTVSGTAFILACVALAQRIFH